MFAILHFVAVKKSALSETARSEVVSLRPVLVRQPKRAGGTLGGRRQSRWLRTADGFAYLNHCRLCPLAAFRRPGLSRNWTPALSCAKRPRKCSRMSRARTHKSGWLSPACSISTFPPLPTGTAAIAMSPVRAINGPHRYVGSLQLLASENVAGWCSLPQIRLPGRWGVMRKCSFRSQKYLSIAALASSLDW